MTVIGLLPFLAGNLAVDLDLEVRGLHREEILPKEGAAVEERVVVAVVVVAGRHRHTGVSPKDHPA